MCYDWLAWVDSGWGLRICGLSASWCWKCFKIHNCAAIHKCTKSHSQMHSERSTNACSDLQIHRTRFTNECQAKLCLWRKKIFVNVFYLQISFYYYYFKKKSVNLIHVCKTLRFICGSHSIYLSICFIFVNLFTFICGSKSICLELRNSSTPITYTPFLSTSA